MRKIVFLIMTIGLAISLVGCDEKGKKVAPEEAKTIMTKALEKTKENSYTVKTEMKTKAKVSVEILGISDSGSITFDNKSTSKKQNNDYYVKNEGSTDSTGCFTDYYSKVEVQSESYFIANGTNYDFYFAENYDGLSGAMIFDYYIESLASFEDELADVNFDFEEFIINWDIFYKSGNTYTAKNINEEDFSFGSEEMTEEFADEGEELQFNVSELVIKVTDDGQLSEIKYKVNGKYSVNETYYKTDLKISMDVCTKYSDYGSTEITVPANILALKTA